MRQRGQLPVLAPVVSELLDTCLLYTQPPRAGGLRTLGDFRYQNSFQAAPCLF